MKCVIAFILSVLALTVATPAKPLLAWNVRFPDGDTVGCTSKSHGESFSVTKLSDWPDSFGPAEMPVAQPTTVTAEAAEVV